MTKKKTPPSDIIAKEILGISLAQEVEDNYYEYALKTIEDRALPDARDGLKPVQRRILYTMAEQGLLPSKSTVKSAKIVGDCMGKYHPHGDSSIYDALVRLAQHFSMSIQLIHPKGNFGDRPGGGWAAARYTESKMSIAAPYLLNELKDDSVEFQPNYDGSEQEPSILPAEFPNLIINGGLGIAVGYATNLPTHNPSEVLDAARQYILNPNITLDKIMKYLPGPDFPTGGEIIGLDGIRESYETGRGKFIIRGASHIKQLPRGRSAIIFTSFPYATDSEKITDDIKKYIASGHITGVTDVTDLSGRKEGTQYTVFVKAGSNPEAVRASIYKYTRFEISFNTNATALVGNRPQVLPLLDQFKAWADFRIVTIRRRSETRKRKAEHRLHIIAGLLKALTDIDTVIKIVRSSENAAAAKEGLIKKFKIDEEQADFILSIPLRRLTKYDQLELNTEKAELEEKVKGLNTLINDEDAVRKQIAADLQAIKKTFSHIPRRSEILGMDLSAHKEASAAATQVQDVEVADGDCFIHLNHKGGAVRSEKEKSGKWAHVIHSTVRGNFIAVTNTGKAYRLESLHVGDRVGPLKAALPESLKRGEYIIAITPEKLPDGIIGGIGMVTKGGVVKIATPTWPKTQNEFTVINLAAGDEIVAAEWIESPESYEFSIMSTDSSLLTFGADKVRPQGLSGGGMAGIKLGEGQHVIAAGLIHASEAAEAMVVTVSDQMTGKQTPLSMYPRKGRATGGVRSQALLKGETSLIAGSISANPILVDVRGEAIALPPVNTKRDGSGKPIDDGKLL